MEQILKSEYPTMRNPIILLSLALLVTVSTVPCSAAPPAAETPGLAVIAPRAFHPALAAYVAHKWGASFVASNS
jgi:hypothetical protein